MKIQFNTDKTISGEERRQSHFNSFLTDALSRFESYITRIEVHLSDENGKKEGHNDVLCLLEARLEGKKPIAVSYQADSVERAISGATGKLVASLDTIIGKSQEH